MRAVDVIGEHTVDEPLLASAVDLGRVLLTCDRDYEAIGARWVREWRRFPGIVLWAQRELDVGTVLMEMERLFSLEDPFAYPIQHLHRRG